MITSNAQQATVLQMIANERLRQDRQWGAENILRRSPHDGLAVLVEEVGDVAKAILERSLGPHDLDSELVQVAAVAVAMLEQRLYGPPPTNPEAT